MKIKLKKSKSDKTKKPRSRKPMKELDTETQKKLLSCARRYDDSRDLEKQIAATKGKMRDEIVGILKKYGTPREGGGFYIELDEFILEVVHRPQFTFSEEDADEFFEDKPKLRKEAIVESYDLEVLKQMNASGEISDAAFAKILRSNDPVEQISVTRR